MLTTLHARAPFVLYSRQCSLLATASQDPMLLTLIENDLNIQNAINLAGTLVYNYVVTEYTSYAVKIVVICLASILSY